MIAWRRWTVTEALEIPHGAFFFNDSRQMFIYIILGERHPVNSF